MFMPKNINSITIIITLEGIEKKKLKKITAKQFEQSRENLQVEWLLFSLSEIHKSWLESTKSCHLSFQNCRKHEMENSTKAI